MALIATVLAVVAAAAWSPWSADHSSSDRLDRYGSSCGCQAGQGQSGATMGTVAAPSLEMRRSCAEHCTSLPDCGGFDHQVGHAHCRLSTVVLHMAHRRGTVGPPTCIAQVRCRGQCCGHLRVDCRKRGDMHWDQKKGKESMLQSAHHSH